MVNGFKSMVYLLRFKVFWGGIIYGGKFVLIFIK